MPRKDTHMSNAESVTKSQMSYDLSSGAVQKTYDLNTKLYRKPRDSNIELLRIFMMLVIVAHHYVVNSGITDVMSLPLTCAKFPNFNTLFALVFGWGGKMAINCFLLITGYFMCQQKFRWQKVLFLYAQIKFYNIIIYMFFLFSGYECFSLKVLYKTVFSVAYGFGNGFTASFLGLYLLVPFLNKVIHGLEKKELQQLLFILSVLFTGFSTFLLNTAFEYIGWYVTVYLLGSYMRLYPIEVFQKKQFTNLMMVLSLVLSWLSVISIIAVSCVIGKKLPYHFFVNDSNKILAIVPAVLLFYVFKNMDIRPSRVINTIAASTFGVLLIHANSDTMRIWLWRDICDNVGAFQTSYFPVHALLITMAVYFVCTCIDMVRKYVCKKTIDWYESQWNRNYSHEQ